MTIAPIETRYAGCRFRSRLEARWAVFFDHLGLDWLYEPEGYDLGDGTRYLPDFLIYPGTDHAFWFEVKGSHPTRDELKKAERLVEGTGLKAYIYFGKIEAPMPDLTITENQDLIPITRWHDDEGWRQGSTPSWELKAKPTAFARFPQSDDWPWRLSGESYFYWWTDCPDCGRVTLKRRGQVGYCPMSTGPTPAFHHNTPRLIAAYQAARSARFEHGESG